MASAWRDHHGHSVRFLLLRQEDVDRWIVHHGEAGRQLGIGLYLKDFGRCLPLRPRRAIGPEPDLLPALDRKGDYGKQDETAHHSGDHGHESTTEDDFIES